MEKTSLRKKSGQQELFLNALAEAYTLQESIINTTELSIISTNKDGIITSFNRAAEKLTGYVADEMVSRTTPLILHDSLQLIERAEQLSLELGVEVEPTINVLTVVPKTKKAPDRHEWTYIRKDGKRFPVLLSTTGIWDEAEQLIGYCCIAIDITERKKSEDELLRSKQNLEALAVNLQEQNRQLDEFAHIISHNLRSPIGNIKALIGLLDNNSTIADYQQIFEKLKNVSNNLAETMNELMETIKVKKDATVECAEIRFKEVFDKVVQSLEGDLIQCEAHISFDFSEAPTINYSKAYLESIFQNLISNAIKYRSTERKPLIRATTSSKENLTILKVSDNGQGIDMERFGDKLFGLHKTFHEHKDARGVGLFLVKTQVEALGGKICAESETDVGTTFIVTF
ncbi:MAG TPA: PAS domain-containing sensor histidine kinase [Chryseolinea sp.]|nr:PAS domain-containing sensor histidine kinase [Chryseolinea sp.]